MCFICVSSNVRAPVSVCVCVPKYFFLCAFVCDRDRDRKYMCISAKAHLSVRFGSLPGAEFHNLEQQQSKSPAALKLSDHFPNHRLILCCEGPQCAHRATFEWHPCVCLSCVPDCGKVFVQSRLPVASLLHLSFQHS